MIKALIVLALIYGAALYSLSPPAPGRPLGISQLTATAACSAVPLPPAPATGTCATTPDKVVSARLLDQDARVVGTIAPKAGGPPTGFWTAYPRSDAATATLLTQLVNSGAKVSVDAQSTEAVVRFVAQYLLPLVILAVLFTLLLTVAGKGSSGAGELLSFGRVGNKRHARRSERRPISFADVAGAREAIVELSEIRDYLGQPSAFARMGALPPKGVLLVGPPGCGKTLMARAVAGEAAAAFFSMAGSEFVESLVGVGAARVRDLFAQARAATPAIVFIDELDAVGRKRGAGVGQGHDEREQTLNEMLVQMDGFSPSEGVVVMAATNRADILDPALLRAGRFDRHISVELPDREGRMEILCLHAGSKPLADAGADLGAVAARTPGFTGADLANVVNESALLAVRERANLIDRHHLDEAVERVQAGPRLRSRIMSRDDKRRVAYHEAAHAVVATAVGRTESIHKVSIVARGAGLGHMKVSGDDRVLLTQRDMNAEIVIAMAGIAVEEIVFGDPSTGSERDLERATATARDMVGRFGMSPRLGRARVLRSPGEVFLGRDYLVAGDVSQPTLERLDIEVRRILAEQEETARHILHANGDTINALAVALNHDETIQGAELDDFLGEVRRYTQPPPGAPSGAGTPTPAPRPG
ncbi:MAG: ATP-dependent zinc metalloprotease FtsH [Actinomycetota bacterium]|nr:ATP-dependent zinc metalloprotease FtsH [Actinomycetota bacterium]